MHERIGVLMRTSILMVLLSIGNLSAELDGKLYWRNGDSIGGSLVGGAKDAIQWDTKLFLGWFGPRGLASIVFIVMVVAEKLPGQSTLVSTVVWNILLSVLAHGLTANPLAKMYSERVKARSGAT